MVTVEWHTMDEDCGRPFAMSDIGDAALASLDEPALSSELVWGHWVSPPVKVRFSAPRSPAFSTTISPG